MGEIEVECNHDWEFYTVKYGFYESSTNVEQAGYCKKCGEDTHGEYPVNLMTR